MCDLYLSGLGLAINQQGINKGPRAVRLTAGINDRRGQFIEKSRGIMKMGGVRLPYVVDCACHALRGAAIDSLRARQASDARVGRMWSRGTLCPWKSLGKLAIPRWFKLPDALRKRRMGSKQPAEAGCGLAEKHMAGFWRVRTLNSRPALESANPFQRTSDACRLARELHS